MYENDVWSGLADFLAKGRWIWTHCRIPDSKAG